MLQRLSIYCSRPFAQSQPHALWVEQSVTLFRHGAGLFRINPEASLPIIFKTPDWIFQSTLQTTEWKTQFYQNKSSESPGHALIAFFQMRPILKASDWFFQSNLLAEQLGLRRGICRCVMEGRNSEKKRDGHRATSSRWRWCRFCWLANYWVRTQRLKRF